VTHGKEFYYYSKEKPSPKSNFTPTIIEKRKREDKSYLGPLPSHSNFFLLYKYIHYKPKEKKKQKSFLYT